MSINMQEIARTDFRTTAQADEINNVFMRKLAMQYRYGPARIAIGRSLEIAEPAVLTEEQLTDLGKPIKGEVLFGNGPELATWVVLIAEHANQNDIVKKDLQNFIAAHWHRGLKALETDWKNNGGDFDKFLVNLLERAGVTHNGNGSIGAGRVDSDDEENSSPNALNIEIGKKADGSSVILELNNTVKHANSHLAITGKPGVGKTQFLLKILSDIRVKSDYKTNFIFFDYKGDVVENKKFLDITKCKPFKLLQGKENLPINPFVLPTYDEQTINVSAREKAESFASINSKIGVVQKGALTDAIRVAYDKRRTTQTKYPDFQEIFSIVEQSYDADGKKDDTLIEILRDLTNFHLFWQHGDKGEPFDKLSDKTLLIDLHKMPVLKELVGYLIIERLYKEMSVLSDSPTVNGFRSIRTILVIDEAHNYLGQKNPFLQKIIREGRSKGIVVFFASQSPNDYQQKFFNFQELLEFAYLFQCEGVSPASIQDILGCSSKESKVLQTEIARLEPFNVIAKGTTKDTGSNKFTAESFFKAYG